KIFSKRTNADTCRANSYVTDASDTEYPGLLFSGNRWVKKSLSARRPTARVDQRAVHLRSVHVKARSPVCLALLNNGSPGRKGNDAWLDCWIWPSRYV